MSRYFILITFMILSLTATSCAPSREVADKKLASACEGSIKILYEQNDRIDIQKTSFMSEKGHDNVSLRIVKLDANFVRYCGTVQKKTWTCSYKEQWSIFGYMPEFYNLEKDDARYGNFDGKIVGDFEALMKINIATEEALY
ncbi:MAG: hypothetical protein KAI76_01975 [Alphaproteobacteria bacterium]|nr:hypothetical protein [Alphaproteobacteria bacterium]